MFPSFPSGDNPSNNLSQEKTKKWKGIFTKALVDVQMQVHSTLTSREDALDYIETLMLRLLITLCSAQPHSIEDVDERINKTFPDPIDKWAIRDAQSAVKEGKKNNIILPVDKIQPLLKEELGFRVDYNLALYIVAVLEYIAADILKISGIYVKNIRHPEITAQDIRVAICADQVLYDMFFQEEDMSVVVEDEPIRKEKMTYEEIVKAIIVDETQYLRDLNMIIRVFRAPFVELFSFSKDPELIFSNILDIYDFTAKLLSSVEDQVEMAQDEVPFVGTCFTDLTENEEFSVYERYVEDMMGKTWKGRLNALLMREDVTEYLKKAGNGFHEAFKYVLPKLLMGPINHCLQYFEMIKSLNNASPSDEDKSSLAQADAVLQGVRARVEKSLGNPQKRKNWELSLRMYAQTRSVTVQKMTEIQKSIEGLDGKDMFQMCSEFIMEGPLRIIRRGNAERYCFLFDGMILLCKPNPRRMSATGPISEYKLKEKFFIRKVEVLDRKDTEDITNAFELHPREQNISIILQAKSLEDKSNWMASLVSLQTRSMLERSLDSKLREEEKNHPLVPPPADEYIFALEDSVQNIIFEENQESQHESPLIKGGQLFKLVERLTYHMYADPRFLRTFLLTYRSFCSPRELLELLIKRFEIPEPTQSAAAMGDEMAALKFREDLKRFRNKYVKPVQFRVVNVFRHWVDYHPYDFERDHELLERLKEFLASIKGKAMRKMADILSKGIARKLESANSEREFTYQNEPPRIEWHIARKSEEFNLMTLHPIEIARQVTLLEFDLYRAIQPSELVGMPWMKKDKQQTAPNLLKMIHFSTNFTYWLELFIIQTPNLEERVAVMSRIIEVMLVFQELNNFNGVLEINSALKSASVYRLEHTKKELPHKYQRALEEASELNNDHFKKYIEKLRSINPPCVPFLGMYLTNILKTEEGNPDFVANAPEGIINFSKRRKVAEITGEIQQFQNQLYCLHPEPTIQEYFASLNPLKNINLKTEKELEDYLYKTSLEIEPREGKPQRNSKRFLEYSLKSPGIKPSTQRHGSSTKGASIPPLPKMSEEDDSSHSMCVTPTSPNKPQSPAMAMANSVNSVFANSPDPSTSSPSQTSMMQFPSSPVYVDPQPSELPEVRRTPPPLPPRRGNSAILSDPALNATPPMPPPRIEPERPPPVPPRRDSMPSAAALARSHSVSHPRSAVALSSSTGGPPAQAFFPAGASTPPQYVGLERRSSERNFATGVGSSDFNDDPGERPVLPPRTYLHHLSHLRNQSS